MSEIPGFMKMDSELGIWRAKVCIVRVQVQGRDHTIGVKQDKTIPSATNPKLTPRGVDPYSRLQASL